VLVTAVFAGYYTESTTNAVNAVTLMRQPKPQASSINCFQTGKGWVYWNGTPAQFTKNRIGGCPKLRRMLWRVRLNLI